MIYIMLCAHNLGDLMSSEPGNNTEGGWKNWSHTQLDIVAAHRTAGKTGHTHN